MAQEMLDSFDRHVDKRDILRPDIISKGISRMHAGHYATQLLLHDAPRASWYRGLVEQYNEVVTHVCIPNP